jgi:hypothetical protein
MGFSTRMVCNVLSVAGEKHHVSILTITIMHALNIFSLGLIFLILFSAHSGVNPDCLRAAKVPIMNQQSCEKDYAHSSQRLIESMLCAGYPGGGVDACKGDSGGPLACYVDGEADLIV